MLRTPLTRLTIAGLAMAASSAIASAQTLSETHELIPGDGSSEFGISCAFSGTIGIVGAHSDQTNGYGSGSAYLFDLVTGQELHKLLPSDGAPNDHFGFSVAISGELAVVGSPHDQDNGNSSGSVYLFDANTGTQLAKLVPNDGDTGDRFGASVAISGDTIFAGAIFDEENGPLTGAVYLFDATTHQEITKLMTSAGALGDQFGYSIDVSGDIAIIGAAYHDNARGCAYLFDVSNPANPQELSKLVASDGAFGDTFGVDVAIDDDRAVVASPNSDVGGFLDIGAAYIFDVTTGAELTKLTPPWVQTNFFAASVSISGNIAIVGDPHANLDLEYSGTAYAFRVNTGSLMAMLEPSHSNSAWGDMAGASVEIQGNTVLVGAPWHDHDSNTLGAAHLFHLEPGLPICFGDPFSGPHCPCGNWGSMGEGCANSTGQGATLAAEGSTNVSFDNLVLEASGLPVGPGIFVQANNAVFLGPPGIQAGLPFGDGMRCVGGGLIRLEIRYSSGGVSHTTVSMATKGKVSAGDTKRYQYYYRDVNGSPCGTGFNLTSGYEIAWTP